MKRHFLGFAAVTVLAFGLGCASDPTGDLTGDVASVETSLSEVAVTIADSTPIVAEARDAQGNALTVIPDVISNDPSIAAVVVADLPPLSQRRFYVKGVSFGTTTLQVSAAGHVTEIEVATFPERIDISGVNDTLRSGDVSTLTLTALDKAGNPVAGVPITVTSSDTAVLALDTATLQVTADEAGLSTLQASGPGGAGGVFSVRVVSGAPASAALSAATFGAVSAGGTSTLELIVLDAAGNENHNISEITSVSVSSSDNGIATVAAAIVDTLADSTQRQIFVTVTGVAGGAVSVTGSVTTTAGVVAFGATPATVLDPQVTASGPSGAPGASITIGGSGLAATGFETLVLVDGVVAGNITALSATSI
ncbi:MAG: hypothetical protein ACREKH_15900, partial [Candidatus Rokuibacteriota bacterium]